MSMLTPISGSPIFYPKFKEMSEGEVVFNKAKYVRAKPNKFNPSVMDHIFQLVDDQDKKFKTEYGETDMCSISAAQVGNAVSPYPYGTCFKVVFKGKSSFVKNGSQMSANNFEIGMWSDNEGNAPVPNATEEATPNVAEAARSTESKSSSSLDDMMS